MVRIPKSYSNTKQIKFYDNKWADMWYRDHFWLSTAVFSMLLLYLLVYLASQHALMN